MATTAATTNESSPRNPFEGGVRNNLQYYGRRIVTTPVGRWLVVVSMLLGLYPEGSAATRISPMLHVAIAFANAFLLLLLADTARNELAHRRGERSA